MWESVEWTWYRRYPGSDALYWHWSPNYGWDLNFWIRGYNEAQIVYLLAIASPTYTMPSSSYHFGWWVVATLMAMPITVPAVGRTGVWRADVLHPLLESRV